MNVLRHGNLVLVTLTVAVLTALAVASSATAAKPRREVIPAPEDRLITNQCAFLCLATSKEVRSIPPSPTGTASPSGCSGSFPATR